MTEKRRDEELRRAFEELREEERRDPPSFARLLADPRRNEERGAVAPRWRGAARVAAGLAAIALLALLSVARRAPTARPEPDALSIVAWRSPTAGLLRTPGRELVAELPRLGELGVGVLAGIDARPTSEPDMPPSERKENDP